MDIGIDDANAQVGRLMRRTVVGVEESSHHLDVWR